ncbi:sensor histidine kinase [Herbihabitans rhizosphaerae]|uniref:sensor histidine kinase n=1 Tax=Herbihabitans rhizosphaerae TaxID=1872711 RepID=UPI0013EE7259|nr:histidine kinase [Herbihabitans rhizosphaerae]
MAGGVRPRDALLTAAVLGATLLAALLLPEGWRDGRPLDGRGAALLAALNLPLLVSGKWPVAALYASLLPQIVYHALDYPHDAAVVAAAVLVYRAARGVSRTTAVLALTPVALVTVLTILLVGGDTPGPEVAATLGWMLFAAVAGQAVRLHKAYLAEVTERARRAEHTREEEAARRVAEERLRIARDLHDVLAHSIAVINVQSSVAVHLLDARPDDPATKEIAEPLRTVSTVSSTALGELRTTLDLLRGNDVDRNEPAPSLDGLSTLVTNTRASGVEATVTEDGDRPALPPSVEITLYRIIQESLTNVVKHAAAPHAWVRVEYRPDGVALTVTDDGRGTGSGGSGYGIIGMTERAHSVGGRLSAGPRTGGGYQVAAWLPLSTVEGS